MIPVELKIQCNWSPSRCDFRTVANPEGCKDIAVVTVRNGEVQLCEGCAKKQPWGQYQAFRITPYEIEYRLFLAARAEIKRLSAVEA